MEENYFDDTKYEKLDFTQQPFPKGEYDHCSFIGCTFSSVNLSGSRFSECVFISCNLSNAKVGGASLQNVHFRDCKILGLRFDDCDPFLFVVGFENCVIDHSSFYNVKLKKTAFINSSLKEADFTGSDLTDAIFDGCDLASAHFERTNLENADLRSAFNYSIDPEQNHLTGALFSLTGIAGLLDKYKIVIQ